VKRNLPKEIKKDLEVRTAIIQIEECNDMTNLRRYPQAKQRGVFKHFAEWLQFYQKKKKKKMRVTSAKSDFAHRRLCGLRKDASSYG